MRELDRVRWIGGSPCSGKTTIAGLLAAPHGLARYSCDDAFDRHAAELDPGRGPVFAKVTTWSVARRLAQPVEDQVADVLALGREQFPLITRDLAARPGPVLAEGAALLPELLAGLGVPATHAVWIVPTPAFQLAHYPDRGWAGALVRDTPDPDEAFRRWMRRDARFAEVIAEQADALGYRVVVVDGSRPPPEIASWIARTWR